MTIMESIRAADVEVVLTILIGAGGTVAFAMGLTLTAMLFLGSYKLYKRLRRIS